MYVCIYVYYNLKIGVNTNLKNELEWELLIIAVKDLTTYFPSHYTCVFINQEKES